MNENNIACVSRSLATVRMTDSGVVSNTPAYVFDVIGTNSGGDVMEADIRNGATDASPIAFEVHAVNGSVNHLHFDPPLYMSRGVYVKCTKKVKSIVVRFAAVRE